MREEYLKSFKTAMLILVGIFFLIILFSLEQVLCLETNQCSYSIPDVLP